MSNSNQHVRERQRLDFAKIQGSIQIPNLIEVQMKSYQRFLQMDLLPSERDDGGLQSVFTSVFPIKDFREMSQLEFVDYAIGNWECKCGNLKGLHHLRAGPGQVPPGHRGQLRAELDAGDPEAAPGQRAGGLARRAPHLDQVIARRQPGQRDEIVEQCLGIVRPNPVVTLGGAVERLPQPLAVFLRLHPGHSATDDPGRSWTS